MTTVQRLPLLTMLGSALVLPGGSAGTGYGRPGDATARGRWRLLAAGPASLALAATGPRPATGLARRALRRAGQSHVGRAPRAAVTCLRGRGS
jgi:hypothetical protein